MNFKEWFEKYKVVVITIFVVFVVCVGIRVAMDMQTPVETEVAKSDEPNEYELKHDADEVTVDEGYNGEGGEVTELPDEITLLLKVVGKEGTQVLATVEESDYADYYRGEVFIDLADYPEVFEAAAEGSYIQVVTNGIMTMSLPPVVPIQSAETSDGTWTLDTTYSEQDDVTEAGAEAGANEAGEDTEGTGEVADEVVPDTTESYEEDGEAIDDAGNSVESDESLEGTSTDTVEGDDMNIGTIEETE